MEIEIEPMIAYIFQSQNGLILTIQLQTIMTSLGQFQSQNGLILTHYPQTLL